MSIISPNFVKNQNQNNYSFENFLKKNKQNSLGSNYFYCDSSLIDNGSDLRVKKVYSLYSPVESHTKMNLDKKQNKKEENFESDDISEGNQNNSFNKIEKGKKKIEEKKNVINSQKNSAKSFEVRRKHFSVEKIHQKNLNSIYVKNKKILYFIKILNFYCLM